MIKKVRKPGQERVRTSAQSIRNTGPSGMSRKRAEIKTEEKPVIEDKAINIDEIILE